MPWCRWGEVAAVQAALEAVFPAELREIYVTRNGVFNCAGQWLVIWPLSEVVTRNREAWSLEGARRGAGWPGSAMTGRAPLSAFRVVAAGVFAWSAVDGEVALLAGTVAGFWCG